MRFDRSNVMKAMVIVSATALIAFGLFWTGEQERLRRVTAQKETQAETSNQRLPKTITVKAGENLQRAIDRARYGDEIVVEAGAVFQGPIILRNKGPLPSGMTDEQAYITIRSSRAGELPSGAAPYTSSEIAAVTNPTTGLWNLDQFPRHQFGWQSYVKPEHAPLMPKIVSAGGGFAPTIQTELGAHHYKLVGLEMRPVDENAFIYDLVLLGFGDSQQDDLSKVPHHLVIDRCYIHAFPNQGLKRGVALNSSDTQIINSYIAGFKVPGQDSQAICGWNGTGRYIIENNYLEGAGENVMFGGAVPAINGLIPTNIVIRRNYFFKPPEWFNSSWQIKNLFELKSAQRVLIEANLFENNWAAAQAGRAILFNSAGDSGSWAKVEDVEFRYNIVRKVAAVFLMADEDWGLPSGKGGNYRVRQNLFYDVSGSIWPSGGNGVFLTIGGKGADNVAIEHNTIMQSGNITLIDGVSQGFVFRDNIVNHGPYGIFGSGSGPDGPTIRDYLPGSVITKNVIIGVQNLYSEPQNWFPPGNYFPRSEKEVGFMDSGRHDYRLKDESAFKGKATNKSDPGVDVSLLNTLLN